MKDFICPFCGTMVSATPATYRQNDDYFNKGYVNFSEGESVTKDAVIIIM